MSGGNTTQGSSDAQQSGGRLRASRHSSCMPCRQKRIKCDTARPVCGQCIRSRAGANTCIYEPKPPPMTVALSNRVSELEDEIRSLEAGNSASNATQGHVGSSSSMSSTHLPVPPAPMYPHQSNTGPPTPRSENPADWPNGDPPEYIRQHLLNTFMSCRHHIVVECYIPRFLYALSQPYGSPDSFHPCLIDAIFLLGSHFSRIGRRHAVPDPQSTLTPTSILDQPSQPIISSTIERHFLARVRTELSESLSLADRLFDFVRASTFLGWWYIRNGRVLEAHHQASSIAHFATSCRLDQLSLPPSLFPYSYPSSEQTQTSSSTPSILGPPRDALDLGERVNAFWSIVALDKTVCLVSGFEGTLNDWKITTMWPSPVEYFEDGRAALASYGSPSTMFHPNDTSLYIPTPLTPHSPAVDENPFSHPVKAIVLFDRAVRLASRARSRSQQVQSSPSHANISGASEAQSDKNEMMILEAKLVQFVNALTALFHSLPPTPPLTSLNVLNGEIESACETYARKYALTIAHAALLELYRIEAHWTRGTGLYERMLDAARAIAGLTEDPDEQQESGVVGVPVFGTSIGLAWSAAAQILIEYCSATTANVASSSASRSSRSSTQPSASTTPHPQDLQKIRRLLSSIRHLAAQNPSYRTHKDRLKDLIKQVGLAL